MSFTNATLNRPLTIVADENIPGLDQYFAALGEIRRYPGRNLSAEQVRDADVLLVRSVTQVNAALLNASTVRFVGTCTIGTDHLDIGWLNASGIRWSAAPGCNANSVVEYVFSALVALSVPWWQQRVGIIGCGNVGGALYRRLTSLGVRCRVYDPLLPPDSVADLASLTDVLAADIICVHAPLTQTGEQPSLHLLGERELAQLRTDAVLISAGRGAVVDNQALLQLLQTRRDLRVVLDVWEPEPQLNPALLDKVALGTPHIAGYSDDGKLTGTAMIYSALCQCLGLPCEPLSIAPVIVQQLNLTDAASDASQLLQAAILGAYDIGQDDRRLRTMVQDVAAGHETIAAGFDRLRKGYSGRREFHGWELLLTAEQLATTLPSCDQSTAEKSLSKVLATLGFKLTQVTA